ncbi:hypothetical protein OEG84_11945 [Hoeflea sp. G2-23]|uniref:DUF680 domain-containing protein n=1 Tax=Hoeflea algicola TaxID=2983763 RepID=A0ABT3Z9D6_9HYPH|nr:hypothetical protein [Hoeflea algicola]MCY0148402.1 hypothetical protein [Hoeflea algicola]
MNKFALAAALSLAAMLPVTASSAFAEPASTQAALCETAPAKATQADIDCTATSQFTRDEDAAAKKYPSGPVNFGNGVVF